MELETADGVGLLGYAGLGATAVGTQPSAWMSAVLRGRPGLGLEQALGVLSDTANEQLPRHLLRMPGPAHAIIIPAFLRGVGARVYSIENALDPANGQHWYRYTSHMQNKTPDSLTMWPPRIALGGTGGVHLARKRRLWERELLRLVGAHERGRVSDVLVADRLAELNYQVHLEVSDGTVGPRCIVAWRRRPDGRRASQGGSHECYTGTKRERYAVGFPTVRNGMDMHSIVGVLMREVERTVGLGFSHSEAVTRLDKDELNRRLAELPVNPDERLR